MKKLIIIIVLVLSTAILFYSCDDTVAGSAAALITQYSSADIVGNAVIDEENNTVEVTVPPMDLAGFNPTVAVSSGALLAAPSSIQDGVAADYTVTAEDGTIVVWKITVTVQYGVRFTHDLTEYIFTNGETDSTYNDEVGAGIPAVTIAGVSQTGAEPGVDEEWPSDNFYFELTTASEGSSDVSNCYFYDESAMSTTWFSPIFTITEYGSVDGVFRATFNNDADMASRAAQAPSPLTGGFAKLLVVTGRPAPPVQ